MKPEQLDVLLTRLADPGIAGSLTDTVRAQVPTAKELFDTGDLTALADLCKTLSSRAWELRERGLIFRLLLAEWVIANAIGDRERADEVARYLAARNRLTERFRIAEAWNWRLLKTALTPETAFTHATAWRELAAVREVAAEYTEGIRYCKTAIATCQQHAEVPGIASARVKAMLQLSVLHRLPGDLESARTVLAQARDFIEANAVEPLLRGLVPLREGALDLVAGRPARALEAYRKAEEAFTGVSEVNRFIVRVRQITCLSRLGEPTQALALADTLAIDYPADTEPYRHGQVLTELAELHQGLGNLYDVEATLDRAEPLYENSTTLEALRWRLHRARNILDLGRPAERAAVHLAVVLQITTHPARQDLTRTMLALHLITRLPASIVVMPGIRTHALHAALVAADVQRTSLQDTGLRFSLHAQRESIYASAVEFYAHTGPAGTVARITELGRADVLNQILATGGRPDLTLTSSPPPDAAQLAAVFAAARMIATDLQAASPQADLAEPLPLPGVDLEPDCLDRLADVLVLAQLWTDAEGGWYSTTSTRPRGENWQTTTQAATPALAPLLPELFADASVAGSIRGSLWEELGRFLLPHQAIWSGSVDEPRSVVICPDPRLWQVPYGALLRESRALVDVAAATLTPSLETLLLQRRHKPGHASTSRPALSLLDPTVSGSEVELAALQAWPHGHHSVTTLQELPDSSLLYVSGLGDGPGAEGVLGPNLVIDELMSALLPQLVILNGCWSGTATSRYGWEPLSLAVGALLGGADIVIAGAGEIGSIGSALVASDFLRLIAQGLPAPEALRQSQRTIRARHPELTPFEWAGLNAIGRAQHL
ncbi:CHAT domain-containing protein [Kribbella lupini]|uniref:CHAT domain-containing protein n=1 Tax=Kribbella lupini TaxID=291602 RepID=A0ABP4NGK0_9ACTN